MTDEHEPARPTSDDSPMRLFGLLSPPGTEGGWRALMRGRKSSISLLSATQRWQDGSPADVERIERIERIIDDLTRMGVPLPPDDYLNPPQYRVTDSVPALRALLLEAWVLTGPIDPADYGPAGSPERYTATLVGRGIIGDLLDTARWRLAVESHRWVAQHPTDGFNDETWWLIWRGVLALRWSLNERRGPLEGYLPSREVAVRESRPVAARCEFREFVPDDGPRTW